MPLYKIIDHSLTTKILVWEINESFDELFKKAVLKEKSKVRLNAMKSELHQRAFLSVRMLLEIVGYTDLDLHYDEFGKPFLNDSKYISITHSHQFSAIIISDENVGIDIEIKRDKIIKIADKFVHPLEFDFLNQDIQQEFIKKLSCIWGAKEAIFKIQSKKGISFKKHIKVNSFEISEKETEAFLHFENICQRYKIYFEELSNYVLVYSLAYYVRTPIK